MRNKPYVSSKKGVGVNKCIRTSMVLSLLPLSLCAEQSVTPYYSIRSQGRNAARNAVGWTNHIYQYDMDSVYSSIAITPEYTRSFRHKRINNCLFGDNLIDNESTLKISGTQTTNRGSKDLLADYFYLPTDFESTVQFKPLIDNFLVDFSFYLDLDEWHNGLYFFLHAPLTHTRWDTNISEEVTKPGIKRHDAGYFTPDNNLLRNQLLKKFQDFVGGTSVTDVNFVTFQGLRFAKISSKRLNRTRLAEIRAGLGWNFRLEHNYHVGLNVQFAAPTGTQPAARFLFEPIVGNGHHWEAGLGLNGHYTFWRNDDETKHASFYVDAHITHLFKTRQRRTFDLKNNGTLSRYMLAQKLGSRRKTPTLTGNADAKVEFQDEFLPVANFSTLNVDVSVGIQADIVAMFNLTINPSTGSGRTGTFAWDIGYNYWGRSCERIKLRKKDTFTEKTFALKGDVNVFGFADGDTAAQQVPVRLAATQSKATIHIGAYAGKNNPEANPDIDSLVPATITQSVDPETNDQQGPRVLTSTGNAFDEGIQINTSNPPIFITENDVDLDGARTKGSSCKVFTHFGYTWLDNDEYKPYLGIGGEIEFDHRDTNSDDCVKCAASQWGIWVKGGVTFD